MTDVSKRDFKLFKAENQEDRRIGFSANSLARIDVLRKAWHIVRESIDDLCLKQPYPAMDRLRREGLWTNESVFCETSGSIYMVDVKIDDGTYVHVKDKIKSHWTLSLVIDTLDFDAVRVTTHKAHRLSAGELISDGDHFIKNPKHFSEEPAPVPPEWIGQPFEPILHVRVIRRVPPTIEALPEQPVCI